MNEKINNKLITLRDNLFTYTLSERNRYKTIYDVIENYTRNNKLFISDLPVISKLKDSSSLENFKYNIYCSNPLVHCNKIINLIYEEISDDPMIAFLNMATIVQNEEFLILHDMRVIARIAALQTAGRRSLDLHKLIKPFVHKGLYYLPAELEIIHIYHMLYTGSCTTSLLTKYEEILQKNILHVTGGAIEKITTCKERKKDEMEAIKIAIVNDFFKGRDDVVLLGGMAIEWIESKGSICPKYDRIQVMSSMNVDDFKLKLEQYLGTFGRNYTITHSGEKDLMIPDDFRTKRYIFSLVLKSDFGIQEKPFLEYFNSCEFELIPVQKISDLYVASKYVILRFLFIDLWTANFVYSIGKLDKAKFAERQKRHIQLIKAARSYEFSADGLLGIFYDYDIHKKESMHGQEKRHFPYFPHNYFERNKKLRII
jgi:hypothetical protein